MGERFIDPRDESPALRRAAVLLERVRQDYGIGVDPELEALEAGIAAMRRAAAAGRLIHESAIDRMQVLVAKLTPVFRCPSDSNVRQLLRCNALAETRELLRRLADGRPEPLPAAAETRDPVHASP